MTTETMTIRRVLGEQLDIQREALQVAQRDEQLLQVQLNDIEVRKQSALALIGGLERALASLPPEAEAELQPQVDNFEPSITDEDPYDAAFGTEGTSEPAKDDTFAAGRAPWPLSLVDVPQEDWVAADRLNYERNAEKATEGDE